MITPSTSLLCWHFSNFHQSMHVSVSECFQPPLTNYWPHCSSNPLPLVANIQPEGCRARSSELLDWLPRSHCTKCEQAADRFTLFRFFQSLPHLYSSYLGNLGLEYRIREGLNPPHSYNLGISESRAGSRLLRWRAKYSTAVQWPALRSFTTRVL